MQNNPDGWGIVARVPSKRGTKIRVFRGLDEDEYMEAVAKLDGCEAIFHTRIATHGMINLENTHPYTIRTESNELIWMMHNGILQGFDDDLVHSDTWHFAQFLRNFTNLTEKLENPTFQSYLSQIIGAHNKLIFFTKKSVVIINPEEGKWNVDNTIWTSNQSPFYKRQKVTYLPKPKPSYTWPSEDILQSQKPSCTTTFEQFKRDEEYMNTQVDYGRAENEEADAYWDNYLSGLKKEETLGKVKVIDSDMFVALNIAAVEETAYDIVEAGDAEKSYTALISSPRNVGIAALERIVECAKPGMYYDV